MELLIFVKINGNYYDFGVFVVDIVKLLWIVIFNNIFIMLVKDGGILFLDVMIKIFCYFDEEEIVK